MSNIFKKPPEDSEAEVVTESEEAVQTTDSPQVIATYSSHPYQNYTLGSFEFKMGICRFYDKESLARFEAMREKLPPQDRARLREIAANRVLATIAESQANTGKHVQGIDTAGVKG